MQNHAQQKHGEEINLLERINVLHIKAARFRAPTRNARIDYQGSKPYQSCKSQIRLFDPAELCLHNPL